MYLLLHLKLNILSKKIKNAHLFVWAFLCYRTFAFCIFRAVNFIYNLLIFKASIILPIIAIFNKKINLFIKGRKETFSKISELKGSETIWFHAASLGEFEQARPIIEEIKKNDPDYKILVSFFSPSGYEIRKNYNLAGCGLLFTIRLKTES